MVQKVLAQFNDAQLFLFVRHLFAVEEFEVVLDDPAGVNTQPEENEYVAVVIDAADLSCSSVLTTLREAHPSAAFVLLAGRRRGFDNMLSRDDLLITSPFEPQKLVRFLRQLRYRCSQRSTGSSAIHTFADLEMNLARMRVSRSGAVVPMTPLQFRLLRYLMEHATEACSREALIEHCWPDGAEVEPRTVDIHLGQIRRTLKRFGPDLVRTVRGTGYALHGPCDNETCAVTPSDD